MAKALNTAQVNHLRRLLGWVRCEVWQTPEEFVETLRSIAPAVGTPDAAAQQRLAETYEKAASVPKYVRAAIKALEPVVKESEGQVIEADAYGPRHHRSNRKSLDHRGGVLRSEKGVAALPPPSKDKA